MLKYLHWFHLGLSFLHVGAGIVMLLIPTKFRTHIDYNGSAVVNSIEVGDLAFTFLFLASLDHLFLFFYDDWYTGVVDAGGVVWPRWLEYSVSASVMNIAIGLMCGINDVFLLLALFAFTVLMMYTGARIEDSDTAVVTRSRMKWLGWMCFCVIWAIIIGYYSDNVAKARRTVPWFVHTIIFVILACEAAFGVVSAVYENREGSEQRAKREVAYAMLSLIAKQSLAWIVFGGTVNRDNSNE